RKNSRSVFTTRWIRADGDRVSVSCSNRIPRRHSRIPLNGSRGMASSAARKWEAGPTKIRSSCPPDSFCVLPDCWQPDALREQQPRPCRQGKRFPERHWHPMPSKKGQDPPYDPVSTRQPRPSSLAKSIILKNTGYPPINLASVGGVVEAETTFKPMLVTPHAAVKPYGASGEQYEREPRPESECEPQHKNKVAEIHRVASVPIRAGCNDTVWGHFHTPTAAGTRQAIAAD